MVCTREALGACISFFFGKEQWKKAPEEVDKILPRLSLDDGATILDLCCGVGRHSIKLAQRGFHVVGMDKTQNFYR